MKKLLALLTVLILLISLCGCSFVFIDKPDTNGPTPSKPDSSADSSDTDSSKNESSAVEDVKEKDVLLVCPLEDSAYVASSITLKSDLTFDMTVNLLSGFGNIKGTYEIGEMKVITCNVSEVDFQGYTGDDVKAFELQPKGTDGYTLRFLDVEFIGALHDGAIFKIESK